METTFTVTESGDTFTLTQVVHEGDARTIVGTNNITRAQARGYVANGAIFVARSSRGFAAHLELRARVA